MKSFFLAEENQYNVVWVLKIIIIKEKLMKQHISLTQTGLFGNAGGWSVGVCGGGYQLPPSHMQKFGLSQGFPFLWSSEKGNGMGAMIRYRRSSVEREKRQDKEWPIQGSNSQPWCCYRHHALINWYNPGSATTQTWTNVTPGLIFFWVSWASPKLQAIKF